MEALQRIPKVLQGIEDLRSNTDAETALQQYKLNVRLFVDNMKREVAQMIEHYERTIQQLRDENSRLKNQSPTKEFVRTGAKTPLNQSKEQNSSSSSRPQHSPLDMMATAKSNLFAPFKTNNFDDEMRFSSVLSKYRRTNDDDNQFPVELINPDPAEGDKNLSRFQAVSRRKKQREEELLHFLETGKKSMHHTTQRFFDSIGKNHKKEEETAVEINKDTSESSINLRRNDSGLNKSLGNICESLETSFISKRARSDKKKRLGQMEEEKRKKEEQEQEMAKIMKQRGVKSLLQRLRDNVENSPTKNPEVIKTSKLLNCGNESPARSPQSTRKNSKVMINPVPVDIAKKSLATGSRSRNTNSPSLSPDRKPQSILKQSSNILTRSLSGISAIDFVE